MTVEIQIRRPCPECEATGVTMHPAWRELHAQEGFKAAPSEEELKAFFDEHGYPTETGLPDVAVICRLCKGEGWQRDWIGIEALAQMIRSSWGAV